MGQGPFCACPGNVLDVFVCPSLPPKVVTSRNLKKRFVRIPRFFSPGRWSLNQKKSSHCPWPYLSPKTTATRMSQFRGQARVQIKRLAWLMTAPPLSTESASVALRWSGLSEASRLSALRTGRPTVRLSSSLADWTSSLPKLDAPLRCSW